MIAGASSLPGAAPSPTPISSRPWSEAELIDIKSADPTIVIDLRYATSRNVLQRPLYPAGLPALVRASVAKRLVAAQSFLVQRGFRLKIWDAYRPKAAHEELWRTIQNDHFVANPSDGVGSLHTRGVAVDATLVDLEGNDVLMPTDFDSFTPDATMHYRGSDPLVRAHLRILQRAMGGAGFYGLRMEWWHFVAPDWKHYHVIPEVSLAAISVASPIQMPSPSPFKLAKSAEALKPMRDSP